MFCNVQNEFGNSSKTTLFSIILHTFQFGLHFVGPDTAPKICVAFQVEPIPNPDPYHFPCIFDTYTFYMTSILAKNNIQDYSNIDTSKSGSLWSFF